MVEQPDLIYSEVLWDWLCLNLMLQNNSTHHVCKDNRHWPMRHTVLLYIEPLFHQTHHIIYTQSQNTRSCVWGWHLLVTVTEHVISCSVFLCLQEVDGSMASVPESFLQKLWVPLMLTKKLKWKLLNSCLSLMCVSVSLHLHRGKGARVFQLPAEASAPPLSTTRSL